MHQRGVHQVNQHQEKNSGRPNKEILLHIQ